MVHSLIHSRRKRHNPMLLPGIHLKGAALTTDLNTAVNVSVRQQSLQPTFCAYRLQRCSWAELPTSIVLNVCMQQPFSILVDSHAKDCRDAAGRGQVATLAA